MYLALFLMPWMLIYALSTIVMNHRDFFRRFYATPAPTFEKERELTYDGSFPPGATPAQMARQILASIDMDGAFGANRTGDGRLIINRQDPIAIRRITYTPADHRVVVERQPFRMNAFFERIHRRRGYDQPYTLEKSWGFSVDLAIFAMIFWVASGLWMWWEMKVTRLTGALFGLSGIAIFALFLATI